MNRREFASALLGVPLLPRLLLAADAKLLSGRSVRTC